MTKKLSRLALLTALGLLAAWLEATLLPPLGVPGIKLGLANLFTVLALYMYGFGAAMMVTFARVALATLLFGSIGEFYAIDVKTKAEAVRFAVSKVAGRMKVLVGVGDTNLDNVRTLAAESEAAGADALVAVSPYYFGPSPDCAKRYFSVILYNFPARTGNDLTPELVADLAAENQNIVGIKDTVDTISHTRKVIAAVRKVNPSFSVLSGFDEYYTVNRISGGNGVLCGLTNVEPETFVSLHHAWQSGDYATAIKSAERISYLMRLYDTADLFISAIKGAVKAKGLPIDTSIHEPAVQLTDEQYRNIQSILK